MRTVKFEELEPGMLVGRSFFGPCVIVETKTRDDFFEGRPSITYIDLGEPFYDEYTRAVDTDDEFDEFEIRYELGTAEWKAKIEAIIDQRMADIEGVHGCTTTP